ATLALQIVGGWEVDTASSGEAAWRSAVARRPDVVLLDVMMPEVDGVSTITRFRADDRTRDLPVIFLTAKSADAASVEWLDLDLAGVITKPFDPMTLADEVTALLRRRLGGS
ncbi:MAG: response regulator, partial [Actinomycetes bacterium]